MAEQNPEGPVTDVQLGSRSQDATYPTQCHVSPNFEESVTSITVKEAE